MGALAVGLTTSLSAMAANVLQDVRYASAPGGKVDITLQFAEPVGDVQAFTTDTPPRIAVDIPDTSNGLSQRRVVIGSGATSAVSAVEAGGRTRVVVDLFRPASYTTRSAGNLLVLTVDAGAVQSNAANAMASSSDPTKKVASDIQVANIDFRRGENGAGRVILRFSGDGAAADMRNEGSKVVVDVANASIPENLRRRLDVTDFATPVQSLEPNANAGSTRLVINTNGAFDSMAYQTGNEYVIEIAPKRGAVIAAAPAARAAGAVAEGSQTQAYTGRAVTFNFQDVPVRTVLQLIAEESNLNVVASDTVQGNVTLRLINVPWDQAMEIVLRAKQLDKRRDGNVIWVAPQKEIADFEKARADARIALEEREELVTEYIPVNYGNAEEIAKLLTEDSKNSGGGAGGAGAGASKGFLSPRGSVSFDNRTNTLLLIDIPKKIAEVRALLATLDRPVDQVLIEARIVVATELFARELGVIFGVQDRVGTLPAAAAAGESTSDSGFLVGLPVDAAAGVLNLSILRSDISLDLELSALEEEGRGEVVSNPRVITANQREAIIRQGDEVGYLTIQPATTPGAVATATVEFKEVLLELKVTPTITQDGRVYLNLMVKKDEVSDLVTNPAGGFVPQIARREVSTAVLIDNGQTVVVGGVYEFKNREDLRKVPFLGDVPVLGNLFRNKGRSTEKAELLIFVTPRILQVAGKP
ncbi:type IV pilus secretin family protein [Arenimonas terrae]|uniref:Type IV pilus secretin family protein n=2 Tax=Arenimonas terrae TaxID=2546226 RepID=A0A5C4RTR9_9GAMM|nr:type IV pilus secretin family protein [Arenimonas terrae]